jgi:integrase/recombinase XerD
VNLLLPKLSTYVGHIDLNSTQRYLTIRRRSCSKPAGASNGMPCREATMRNAVLLGPWIRRFLLEHLVTERNLSRNTQRSYRDAFALLIPFVGAKLHKPSDQLSVTDLSSEKVRAFLAGLEQLRGCSISTRNQRLAAVHSLARFVALHCPEYIGWSGELRSIPFKKTSQRPVAYLEKPEMDGLLNAPDQGTAQGRRDYVLLLFLYNTGARADEAAQLLIGDLNLAVRPQDYSSVSIRGKGGLSILAIIPIATRV